MGLAAAIIIDVRESIDGPAQHRYVDSLPRAKGQVEVEGGADEGWRGRPAARPCGSCSSRLKVAVVGDPSRQPINGFYGLTS